ncbi:dehydrodolichyl diphosphate synthase complex subunit Nus1-like [Homarus americanus]|uniref:ditrans,polycis-polyprenyl diphosphate synthase [(2E,6E)-farnesyldiphosphate specific] n=1 Tax=Homarus americanus TaxID=6706 RepID=A0A8J5MJA0_HOMAM|nr:dehydrodolichyl diphosphate synthase complex subunit Nus1-like [Homarus americanus]KAG7153486.1 Dehydrodolichyl diphosphate synthase complex subunit Nus1-like [Homarus americanus]
MDVLLPVFQLLYFVAHFLASLALSVIDTFFHLHRLLLRVYSFLVLARVPPGRLQADAAQLKKVPQHLGLVCVGQQAHHVAQLSTVISWAIGYGVHYVSLYDAHGVLKRKRPALLGALRESDSDVLYNVVSYGRDRHPDRDVVAGKRAEANGTTRHREITVNLLSQADGRSNLASAARRLCSEGCKITAAMIESRLVTLGQPDPDVVITIGEPISTLGFLPWQVRLSEFFSTPSLSRFEYNSFQTILRRYSKCEQRFGK